VLVRATAHPAVRAAAHPGLRAALVAVAALYLAGVWLDSIGPDVASYVPQPFLYFTQVAGLFTSAATMSIDYRAEAWICDDAEWVELDTRPYFAINRENKENRFYRVMHFYKQQRETMRALDRYLFDAHASGEEDDGVPRATRIGGLRFLSVRHALPAPGAPAVHWHRVPINEYSAEDRHYWYWTPGSERRERCGEPPLTRREDKP
jgi:hypothetical protein